MCWRFDSTYLCRPFLGWAPEPAFAASPLPPPPPPPRRPPRCQRPPVHSTGTAEGGPRIPKTNIHYSALLSPGSVGGRFLGHRRRSLLAPGLSVPAASRKRYPPCWFQYTVIPVLDCCNLLILLTFLLAFIRSAPPMHNIQL
jgi:hypothetical protein